MEAKILLPCEKTCSHGLDCPNCPIVKSQIKQVFAKVSNITVQGHQVFSTQEEMSLVGIVHKGILNYNPTFQI